MELKKCSTCAKIKAKTDFHKNKNTKDGLSSRCKECAIKAAADYAHNNYNLILSNKRLRRENLKYSLRESAKSRALKNGVPFNLEFDDIFVPEFCPVLNIKLEKSVKSHAPNSPSLDRIIPELGYVKGNIIVMSYKANAMKNNATPEELKNFANLVLQFFKDKENNE